MNNAAPPLLRAGHFGVATTNSSNNNNNNSAKMHILTNAQQTDLGRRSGDKMQAARDPSSLATSSSNSSGGGKQANNVLVQYNYYGQNGTRQEQVNVDAMRAHQNEQQQQQQRRAHVQRHLSPSFKESLDQIVSKSSKMFQSTNAAAVVVAGGGGGGGGGGDAGSSPSASPTSSASDSSSSSLGYCSREPRSSSPNNTNDGAVALSTAPHASVGMTLTRRYKWALYEQRCVRCQTTVYHMDKVGPLKDFTFYHQNCFKCRECGTKLTLKTYFNNQQCSDDLEVYCHRHCPKTGPGRLDNQAVGIRAALNAPKVFDATMHANELAATATAAAANPMQGTDVRALFIQHAVQQTRMHNAYNATVAAVAAGQRPAHHHPLQQQQQQQHQQQSVDKQIAQFINGRLEYLEPKQKMLEMRHREEEDALFKTFERKWREEEKSISEQIRDEWQVELSKLLDKYKRQLSSISSNGSSSANNNNNKNTKIALAADKLRAQVAAAAAAAAAAASAAKQQQQQHSDLVGIAHAQHHHHYNNAPMQQQQQQQQDAAMIELERMNLEKTMTLKLGKKRETLKRKLKEFERQATAELVEKQSREMLALISMKLDEYKEEQRRKIGSDLEQFEAIESLANQLGSSLQLATTAAAANGRPQQQQQQQQQPLLEVKQTSPRSQQQQQQLHGKKQRASPTSAIVQVPAPKPPLISKLELYNNRDAPDELFRDIDERAINIAREDQQTFTDLVHHLTRHCLTDVQKVRAIFRWITVKNLNTMKFDSSVKPDTPLGLLRGIKNGSESYHVLFKRLCSYAGLHCVLIKGYSKSAGYQPGHKFDSNQFRNSWNAVYVAGAWRFVQCNWGARHLVTVAVMQDPKNQVNGGSGSGKLRRSPTALAADQQVRHQAAPPPPPLPTNGRSHAAKDASEICNGNGNCNGGSKQRGTSMSPCSSISTSSHSSTSSARSKTTAASDALRYEYDDHYFLTDPDEFIYEFYPLASEWQLIRQRPITLAEFEQLPFVRSLFFKYGLYFPQRDIRSVLHADSSGAVTIKIGMPTHMVPSLIFHYNLRYYDSDCEYYQDVSLKRYVMQSVESGPVASSSASSPETSIANVVTFRVHLPENGAYLIDIFANATTPKQYISGEPMKFKSVCKFKIVAKGLRSVMIPLPNCTNGEYGPMKATRLFGIIPITHDSALITVANDKRVLEIQLRMTRPMQNFVASLHKNGYDECQLSKGIHIYIDGDIVYVTVKFFMDGQYGLDLYTRDQVCANDAQSTPAAADSSKDNVLTHCCKYLINVSTPNARQ